MQDEMHRPVPFWHRPGPKTVLPWITSLVFHATLLALMILLVPPLIKLVNHTPAPAPVTSNDGMDTQTKVDSLPSSPSSDLPPLPKPNNNIREGTDTTPFSPGNNDALRQAMKAGLKGDTTSIAVGADGSIGQIHGTPGGSIVSNSDRDQSGRKSLGEPNVGGDSMFTDIPGIKLPKSVCYVCDASGSMNNGNKADVLRDALKGAVNGLYPVQQFNVFFFQQGQTGQDFLAESDHLIMATPTNRAKVADFVDNQVGFHGETDAVPALKEAFKEKPEVIFLLTDGLWEKPGPDGPGMLKWIDQLNSDKQVRVNTILLFVDQKDEANNADADQIMEQIAKENGGTFKKCLADKF